MTATTSAAAGRIAPVAVVGASGKTGRAVSAALLRRGVPVRGLVRHAGRTGEDVAEAVVDLDTGEGLVAAFEGCAAVYLMAPNVHPDEPGLIGRALQAAREVGVGRVVLHSVLHPYASALPHHMGKAVAEEMVRASGLPWTALQPCAYAQNLTAGLSAALDAGRLEVPYRIDAPFTLVDLDDVAEVAATVLTEPGHEAASYELWGRTPSPWRRWRPRPPASPAATWSPHAPSPMPGSPARAPACPSTPALRCTPCSWPMTRQGSWADARAALAVGPAVDTGHRRRRPRPDLTSDSACTS